MKIAKLWLEELVELNVSWEKLEELLSLHTIGVDKRTDDYIELDIKGHHRADLLSMRGIAYEVAAITDSKIRFEETEPNLQNSGKLSVEVQNPELAPMYSIAKIEGLKVDRSPEDWVKKLEGAGMRSINNIADVTNLVMLEFGQPLHAFDAATVVDEKIIVRCANPGEQIETLDAKKRDLQPFDLLISDPEKNLGIAGVMGGKNSEVTNNTSSILLEAAIFDPQTLRKTSQRLNLTSEASKRFYHGLTKKKLLQALEAAIKMYEQLGGKVTGISVIGDYENKQPSIRVRHHKINSLIGIDLSNKEIEQFLRQLYFEISHPREDEDLDSPFQRNDKVGTYKVWEVVPPYWRLDIAIEEDVIEEIARMYGYEKIPAKELSGEAPEKIDQSLFELIYKLKKHLADLGLTEVQTYSFFSTDVIDNHGFDREKMVKLSNPISAETEYLRGDIWPNLVEVIAKNAKKGFEKIAVFEIGKVYQPQEEGVPKESYRLSLALMNGIDNPIEELNKFLISNFKFLISNEQSNGRREITLRQKSVPDLKFVHPHRHAFIEQGDKQIGGTGEVHKRVSDRFGLKSRVAVAEVEIDQL